LGGVLFVRLLHVTALSVLAIFSSSIFAQDVSNIEDPLDSNLILQCDVARTDYQFNYKLLYFFRYRLENVGVVALYPNTIQEIENPLQTNIFPSTFAYKSFVNYIEVYDWYSGYEWYEGAIQKKRFYKGSVISRTDASYSSWSDRSVRGVCKEITRSEGRSVIDQFNSELRSKIQKGSANQLF
jgi:hypothetical protein